MAAYANHFENEFHFDDFHSITNNPSIRELRNIPRFFIDPALFSALPGTPWRPVVSASLAIDYWLGGGLRPFYFHLSTFFWFCLLLLLMFFLFRRIMDKTDPHPTNVWTALFATACYGLHPANAETVNYIVQRGDLYNTLGVVASLLWYEAYPAQRKYGWYLIPAVLAYFAKAPALIYPLILAAYVLSFEYPGKWRPALRATFPALAVTLAAALAIWRMTPNFSGGAQSASLYRVTQPWVALRYFKSFFLPTGLSVDSDWGYVPGAFSMPALAGYGFVAALLAAATIAWRKREGRPVAFGILWFILALLPTSWMPLAEVTNDHRMFFPFVGLTLAVVWTVRLVWIRRRNELPARTALAGAAVVLAAAALGTHQRNEVWRTEESLWRDAVAKSPKNGRAWMYYANVYMNRGDYATALEYFERAEPLSRGKPFEPILVSAAELARSMLNNVNRGREDLHRPR